MTTFRKFLTISCVAVLITAVLMSTSSAQRMGMRGLAFGGPNTSEITLLGMEEVLKHLQDEYELDEDASKEIKELADAALEELMEERRGIMQDIRSMDDDERAEAIEYLQDTVKEINTESFAKAKKLLDEKQLKRLGQLKIQRMEMAAMLEKDVQKKLKIDKEQNEDLKMAQESFDESFQAMIQEMRDSGDFDREVMQKGSDKLRKTLKEEMMAVLTDEQKAKYKELIGTEFKFPAPQSRRRGGRGR